MDVKAIRTAIAARVHGIPVGATTLTAKGHVSAGSPPFAYPGDTSGNYHESMDGAAGLSLTLRVLTSMAEDQSGQEMLDDLLASSGASSVKAAIEADQTLGGLCDSLSVTGFEGYQDYEVASTSYYGAEVTVVIYA